MQFDQTLDGVRTLRRLSEKYGRLAKVARSRPRRTRLQRKAEGYARRAVGRKQGIRLRHFLQKMDRLLIPRIAASTVQLFADSDFNRHSAGTGTLLRINGLHFLVSASHALEYMKPESGMQMFVFSADQLTDIQLTGALHRYTDPAVDLGVALLDDPVVQHLSGYSFLGLGDIDLRPERAGDVFYVAGFPAALTQIHVGVRLIRSNLLTNVCKPLLGIADGEFQDYNATQHILLDAIANECDLVGISGCAVWRAYAEGDSPEAWTSQGARVVGVETDQYRNRTIIRATRWKAVCSLLWEKYPGLRAVLGAESDL